MSEEHINPRWGDEVKGKGPWRRMQRKDLGFGPDGRRMWGDPVCVWQSDDYHKLWDAASKDWHERGIASKIVDVNGTTCMIFD